MIALLQACLLIAFAPSVNATPLSEPFPSLALLNPLSHNNLTHFPLTLNVTGPCPRDPEPDIDWKGFDFHDITVHLRLGPAINANVMTNLLEYSLSQIEPLIEAHGETAYDPRGLYHYTLWQGLILDIQANNQATLARLDYGRVGDFTEFLINYNVVGRRFCMIQEFEISFLTVIDEHWAEEVIGTGKLWTH